MKRSILPFQRFPVNQPSSINKKTNSDISRIKERPTTGENLQYLPDATSPQTLLPLPLPLIPKEPATGRHTHKKVYSITSHSIKSCHLKPAACPSPHVPPSSLQPDSQPYCSLCWPQSGDPKTVNPIFLPRVQEAKPPTFLVLVFFSFLHIHFTFVTRTKEAHVLIYLR